MGNYNNEYRHYYKKVSNYEENEISSYDEDLNNKYGRNFSKNSRGNNKFTTGQYALRGIIGTTMISTILFGTLLGEKLFLEKSKNSIYDKVKMAIETDGKYENLMKELAESIKKKSSSVLSIGQRSRDLTNNSVEKNAIGKTSPKGNSIIQSYKLSDNSLESIILGDLKYKSELPVKTYKEVHNDGEQIVFKEAVGSVVSMLSGEVISSSGKNGEKCIEVDHGDDIKAFYYNVSSAKVKKGDKIVKGDIIGQLKSKADLKIIVKEREKVLDLNEYLSFNRT